MLYLIIKITLILLKNEQSSGRNPILSIISSTPLIKESWLENLLSSL